MSVFKDVICYCEKAKGKFFLLSPFTTSENVIERKKASAIAGAFFYSKRPGQSMQNKTKTNARSANGALRRKHRARLKAMGGECGICKGRLGPIHYDEPSNPQHPLSFVIDEIKPISRWKEFGYASAREAAEDWNNLQAAHYVCNNLKSNKIGYDLSQACTQNTRGKRLNAIDGDW